MAYLGHNNSAFLWYNMSVKDLTPDVVVNFLSSQLFLATRFRGASQSVDKDRCLALLPSVIFMFCILYIICISQRVRAGL
jgi:hypothetical protein